MKKYIALLLAVVMTLSLGSVVAMAQENQPQIVIDGVKDEAYTDAKMFNHDYWSFYGDDNISQVDPVDVERVKNTVWFTWDDEFVYIYFQAESKDDLYVPCDIPARGDHNKPSYMPTGYEEWKTQEDVEYVRLFLDTAPSLGYDSPCRWAGQNGNGERCDHFACATGDNSATNDYRLMCRNYVAWDFWDDYSTPNEGVFMDYEGWVSRRLDPASPHYRPHYGEGDEELARATYAANGGGNGEAASFIDYQTNTYGIEVKFRRAPGEECFQFNFENKAKYIEWDEEGPELAYHLSFCNAWWLNSSQMLTVYYEDYPVEDDPVILDPHPIGRLLEQLPDSVENITLEHKELVLKLNHEYNKLSDQEKAYLDAETIQFIEDAYAKIGELEYIANLGDVNEDGKINANDALVALRAAVGKMELNEAEILRADVNGDKAVNAKDALEMLQFAVGKRTAFSVVDLLA